MMNNQQQHQETQKEKYVFTKYSDKFKDILLKKPAEVEEPSIKASQAATVQLEKTNSITKPFFFFRVKSIGVGAHSFVYLVQEEDTHCLLAQKSILKPHALQNLKDLLGQLKILFHTCHDNLIKLYYVYTDESYIHMIMEYAQDSLFALKQKFILFKQKEIIEILKQLLRGIKYLHQNKIVHADIKLENIMIANGVVKLCDFGYAHVEGASQITGKVDVVGTLEYLSPEYAQGKDSGWKRDIWAVGILAFEMLVGKNPFEGLKQNQKWAKLVQNTSEQYLTQLRQLSQQMSVKSQKIQEFIKRSLCDESQRWSAQQLLQLPFLS